MGEKSGRKKYTIGKNGRNPENGKESPHSAHANGINEYIPQLF